ncbi:hypothetical protein [Alcaligenes sp. WGS1538]|uniref:hypothetical protein n=1 Tax=Alcaligenes sp. WGS1538 TaxID=3366811 RepID=UPI00372D6765
MRKTVVILASVALTGCAGMMDIKGTGYVVEADPGYVALSIDNLKRQLKDPESARISGVYTVKTEYTGDTVNVCGLINAKNSYGGYTGSRLFAATPTVVYIERQVIGGSDYEAITNNNYVITHCKLRDGERHVFLPQYKN